MSISSYVVPSTKETGNMNNHLVIIDFTADKENWLINLNHVFNTYDGSTPRKKFGHQLEDVKNAATKNLIVIGDFNINT